MATLYFIMLMISLNQLLTILSAVDAMISAHNEWKVEMEAEYRLEMESYYNQGDYYKKIIL